MPVLPDSGPAICVHNTTYAVVNDGDSDASFQLECEQDVTPFGLAIPTGYLYVASSCSDNMSSSLLDCEHTGYVYTAETDTSPELCTDANGLTKSEQMRA